MVLTQFWPKVVSLRFKKSTDEMPLGKKECSMKKYGIKSFFLLCDIASFVVAIIEIAAQNTKVIFGLTWSKFCTWTHNSPNYDKC